ncbi:MAG: hypothetical protein ABI036_01235 [Fibrobacteria bacterium]
MIDFRSSAWTALLTPVSTFKWMIFALLGGATLAAAGTRLASPLDTAFIRKNYLEGEFSKVIDSLESWRKAGSQGSHSDSVFAYRHLGIVYASYETARVRAESYLNLLLRLEPRTEVLDPYISDAVEDFWVKVKIRNKKDLDPPRAAEPLSSVNPKPRIDSSSSGRFPWFWVASGAALAGGAVAVWLLTQEPSPGGPASPSVASLDTANIHIRVLKQP